MRALGVGSKPLPRAGIFAVGCGAAEELSYGGHLSYFWLCSVNIGLIFLLGM